jgi:predicted alpha/beta superfamily hydrolase
MLHFNEKELPNNLRINRDGVLYCADGRDVQEYLRETFKPWFDEKDDDVEVVITGRKTFLRLNTHALLGQVYGV